MSKSLSVHRLPAAAAAASELEADEHDAAALQVRERVSAIELAGEQGQERETWRCPTATSDAATHLGAAAGAVGCTASITFCMDAIFLDGLSTAGGAAGRVVAVAAADDGGAVTAGAVVDTVGFACRQMDKRTQQQTGCG